MKMKYMLDTNICIYIIKKKPVKVLEKFKTLQEGMVGMSLITLGELKYGIEKSQHPEKNMKVLDSITKIIPALPMHKYVADHYGEIRKKLEKKGQTIGNNDLWISAHALALDIILVTNNTKEFTRVPNLKLENWI